MVVSFFERLYSFRLIHGDGDRIGWSPFIRSKFVVKSLYQVLIGSNGFSFPWKSICRVKAPLRMAFFVCTIALDIDTG